MYCLANLLFFDIPLSYYYNNLNLSVTCCLFPGDVYIYFGISISFTSVFEGNSFEAFCPWNSFGDFEIIVTLSAVLLIIKSPVASIVFWIALF